MKLKTALSHLALLAALAVPLPAVAQINPPATPLADGLPQEALDRLWCAGLFYDQAEVSAMDGDSDLALATVGMVDLLGNPARDLLRGQGVAEERIQELEDYYYWDIVATSAVFPGSVLQSRAACRAAFGAVDGQVPLFSDFDCGVAYWTWASFVPSDLEVSMERVRFVAFRHQEANPGADMAAVQQQMLATVEARAQRIQQGAESPEHLQADLAACEAHYGF